MCDLNSANASQWISIDLPNYSFTKRYYRKVALIDKTIMYFGSVTSKQTFILEKEEESKNLKVVREGEDINFKVSS